MELDIKTVPSLERRLEFLEHIKSVSNPSAAGNSRKFARVTPAASTGDGKQEATLIRNTLWHCMAGLTRQEKSEIKNSIRLAELVSDEFADQTLSLAEWLKLYSRALNHVGWYSDRNPGEKVYNDFSRTVSQKMIDTVKALGNEPMLANSFAAMAALQTNPSYLAAYAKASQWGRAFQVVPSGRDAQGKLTLILNHARLNTQREVNDFLFFRWETNAAVLQHNYLSFYLDRAAYAQTRQKTETLLEDHDMAELEIRL